MSFLRQYKEEDGSDTSKENAGHNPADYHTTHSPVVRIVDVLPINLFRLWSLSKLDAALLRFWNLKIGS